MLYRQIIAFRMRLDNQKDPTILHCVDCKLSKIYDMGMVSVSDYQNFFSVPSLSFYPSHLLPLSLFLWPPSRLKWFA